MEDKELLELAAKAAGYEISDWRETINGIRPALTLGNQPGRWIWDPLTDDGDALRLAAKLKLSIVFGVNYVIVDGDQSPTVNNTNDPSLAVRQAIVRAAAEICLARHPTKD